jgi:transposase
MRYGLMSNVRRSWSKKGARAVMPTQQMFANRYLYSAVAPVTGDNFHLMGLSDMNSATELLFLQELKKQHPDIHVIVVMDNAPSHRGKPIHEISGLSVIHLPSYSPELDPAERFFEEVRKSTACRTFVDLAAQEELIAACVKKLGDDSAGMKQLTGYEWIREQCSVVS